MMKTKLLFAALLSLVLVFGGYAAWAEDEDDDEDRVKVKKAEQEHKPGKGPVKALEQALERIQKFELKHQEDFDKPVRPTLGINPEGHVRITGGKVISLGANSLVVKVWGLAFTVNVSGETKIFAGKESPLAFADIQVDDAVNLVGRTSENAPGVIEADVIHDRSAVFKARDEEIARMRVLLEDLIRKLQELLQRAGRPLPPGFSPVPSPTVSPSPAPSPSPSPAPSPSA